MWALGDDGQRTAYLLPTRRSVLELIRGEFGTNSRTLHSCALQPVRTGAGDSRGILRLLAMELRVGRYPGARPFRLQVV